MPEQVRGRRRLLGAERAGGVAQLGEAVGREQRREDRGEQEDAGEHQAGDQHAALQADALPQLADDGQARASRAGAAASAVGGRRSTCGGHQYLTRGSISAAMTSTMKLVTATMTASSTTMPWTATKSRACRYCVELEAQALPLERRLGEHRAAEQQRDLQADDGDDRDQRRPVGVLASAAGARCTPRERAGLDVAHAERADDVGAHQPEEDPGGEQAEGDAPAARRAGGRR